MINSESVKKSTKITKSRQLLKNQNFLPFSIEVNLVLVGINSQCIFPRQIALFVSGPISLVQNKVETGTSLHDSLMETATLLAKKTVFVGIYRIHTSYQPRFWSVL